MTRLLLITSTLTLAWLGMQVVHEAGHVIGALATGGEVTAVDLHPLRFSRTDLTHNPQPLIVSWAGPVIGSLLPLLAAIVCRLAHAPGRYIVTFFAGACLVINGAYIGVGAMVDVGDAADLIIYGAPRWQLLTFGLLTAPLGLLLWHRLGPHFGLGPSARPVNPKHACITAALALLLILAELLYTALAPSTL